MSGLQKKIQSHSQHPRPRCRKGEMPEVRREKTGADSLRLSGQNLQKELRKSAGRSRAPTELLSQGGRSLWGFTPQVRDDSCPREVPLGTPRKPGERPSSAREGSCKGHPVSIRCAGGSAPSDDENSFLLFRVGCPPGFRFSPFSGEFLFRMPEALPPRPGPGQNNRELP